jgi:hypothetical protein
MLKNLINKLKMKNKNEDIRNNPGKVYIPDEFEVEERKKDVDANEK